MFLNHLHDVFFLQGAKSSNKCVDDFELKWGAVLPDGFLADNNTYVLAMALVTVHKNENQEPQWVKIELIESFVPHFWCRATAHVQASTTFRATVVSKQHCSQPNIF